MTSDDWNSTAKDPQLGLQEEDMCWDYREVEKPAEPAAA